MATLTAPGANLPIAKGNLKQGALLGKVAIVTGAGRGIGFEAARSLAWLGAQVVIAEIDAKTGGEAARKICEEFGDGAARLIQTDVGNEAGVAELANRVSSLYGKADIVINNATIFSVGSVVKAGIHEWDRSYAVNLRGPVLMAKAFLPPMLKANWGVFVNVSSSGAAPYLGTYEVFKTAQVELASTLDAELEGTGVIAFTIGPGLVRTPGSAEGMAKLAPLYGKTVDEFMEMSSQAVIPIEEAGAGFAAAVAMAERYRGKETSSMAGLIDAGIPIPGQEVQSAAPVGALDLGAVLEATRAARDALEKLNSTWHGYSIFFRQWLYRDFKKNAGMSMDDWSRKFQTLENGLQEKKDASPALSCLPDLKTLAAFFDHLVEAQKGYQKDPAKLEEGLQAIREWQKPVKHLVDVLEGQATAK